MLLFSVFRAVFSFIYNIRSIWIFQGVNCRYQPTREISFCARPRTFFFAKLGRRTCRLLHGNLYYRLDDPESCYSCVELASSGIEPETFVIPKRMLNRLSYRSTQVECRFWNANSSKTFKLKIHDMRVGGKFHVWNLLVRLTRKPSCYHFRNDTRVTPALSRHFLADTGLRSSGVFKLTTAIVHAKFRAISPSGEVQRDLLQMERATGWTRKTVA